MIEIGQECIWKDGVAGLYKGLPIALVGGVPGAFLYFGTYELWKKHTLEYTYLQDRPFLSYLSAGMFAELVACLLFVPIDVIKERL